MASLGNKKKKDAAAKEKEKLELAVDNDQEVPSRVHDIGAFAVGRGAEINDDEEGKQDSQSQADYVVGIDAFRVPTKEERTRQNVIRLQQQAKDAPLVEARVLNSDNDNNKSSSESENSNRKRYILFAIIAIVIVALAVVIPSVLVTRRRRQNESTSSTMTTEGNETTTTSIPTISPTIDTVPSSSPSLSLSPTTAAFQQVLSLLGFDDDINEDIIPNNANHHNYRAIDWMAHQDQVTPTLIQQTLMGNENDAEQAKASALQRFAMVSFFYATEGESWSRSLGFLNATQHECEWRVPTVEHIDIEDFVDFVSGAEDQVDTVNCINDTVVELSIDDNNLGGSLPDSIGILTKLSWLELTRNNIGGTLPRALFQLTQLRVLVVIFNEFVGTIPSEVKNLVQLENWVTRFNLLTGSIPESVGGMTKLKVFDSAVNFHTGSIPSSFQYMTDLIQLRFSFNLMTSTLPSELNSLQKLEHYTINDNMLTGTMPFVEGSNPLLGTVEADFSKFVGDLSPFLHLTSLRDIYFEGTPFTGTIPSEFCNLPITIFAGGLNQLSGSIPNCFGQLTNMTAFFMHTNPLTGTVPLLPLSLNQMGIFETQLTGPYPLQAFPNMTNIYLRLNNFTPSPIPSAFFEMTSLSVASLTRSNFTGTIPTRIGEMTNLEQFRVSIGQLSGTIPTEIGLLTKLTYLALSTNAMTGTIPTELGNLVKMTQLALHANFHTGTVPQEALLNMTSLRIFSLFSVNLTDDVSFLCSNRPPFDKFEANCDAFSNCTCCTSCCDVESIDTCIPLSENFV